MKIKKISEIKNFSIFKDFTWDSSLGLGNGQSYDFKDINIFYGRNYSGKTSLSKIIRSLETKKISDKYHNPDFRIKLSNDTDITQNTLQTFEHPIHVYNSDFVKENLKFIHNEDENIESFSVTLGGNNRQIQDRIQELNDELGSNTETLKSGIYLEIQNKESEVRNAHSNYDTKKRHLEKLLSDKATRGSSSIKDNHERFGEIRYDKRNLEADIAVVLDKHYQQLTMIQRESFDSIIQQRELPIPPKLTTYTISFSSLINSTTQILKTVVGGSQKIEELVKDSELNSWVQIGHHLHKDRPSCAFCSNTITEQRQTELRQHFDEETQRLQNRITDGIEHINNLLESQNFKISFDINHYYQKHHATLAKLKENLHATIELQKKSLKQIINLLEQKNRQLFTESEAEYPLDYSDQIKAILVQVSRIRDECIQLNSDFKAQQMEAKKALRLDHIYQFLQTINYTHLTSEIELASQAIAPLETELTTLKTKKDIILSEIETEKAKLKSEGEACNRIKDLLNHEFGHSSLSLEPIEVDTTNGKQIKFEIQRIKDGNKTKAHNLSEGECSLISFCYFLAKVQESLNNGKEPIIWIDDPICSLDSNHIFFIYSLINEKICLQGNYSQLFISTHNLDFLKYLKRLNVQVIRNERQKKLEVNKFLISREEYFSRISQMPKYLSEYSTEFNYLFKQIYTCASTNILNDENHSMFYNFSNNARKFIEIYSFFKFPSYFKYEDERLKVFWNDEIYRLFIGRVNNEYSHCAGVLERGMSLMDVPEMHRVAKAIIQKVKEDTQQYMALLESINIDIANDPLSSPQTEAA